MERWETDVRGCIDNCVEEGNINDAELVPAIIGMTPEGQFKTYIMIKERDLNV